MKSIVATICCRRKREDPGLLPARERYLSERIARSAELAAAAGLPLAILSGKYGLIESDFPIPYYDKLMAPEETAETAAKNAAWLRKNQVGRVIFLVNSPRDDPQVVAYLESMRRGAKEAGARLEVIFVPPYPAALNPGN
jgi:hypothetical protein